MAKVHEVDTILQESVMQQQKPNSSKESRTDCVINVQLKLLVQVICSRHNSSHDSM